MTETEAINLATKKLKCSVTKIAPYGTGYVMLDSINKTMPVIMVDSDSGTVGRIDPIFDLKGIKEALTKAHNV